MIKNLVLSLSKKYIITAINDLLERYSDDVSKVSEIIEQWISRLTVIIDELRCILSRVSDGKIESDEVDESVDEISRIIKEW